IRERVDAVIHCGDLFDSPDPRPRVYYHAIKSLKKLADAGIQFYVIAGQHDKHRRVDISPLRILEEVGVARVLAVSRPETHSLKLRSGELGVVAIPYAEPDIVQKWVKELKKPEVSRSILMAHLLVKELGFPWSHISLLELNVQDYAYIALGDLHRRYDMIYRGVPVVYPGSPEALKIDERSDERFIAIADLSSREVVVEWVKLSRFRKMMLIENVGSLGEFSKALSALNFASIDKPPILYVELGKPRDTHGTDEKNIKAKLDELVRQELILEYRIIPPEVAATESTSLDVEVDVESPVLSRVIYEVLRDPEVAEFVVKILESGEDVEVVKKITQEVVDGGKLLSKLEKLVSRR
ncbi:MAG: metallophosphoesterase family protein, partial [Sulfolobales archaeon]|nr:metallophosphoesterase family protein [Sulfolobales archaeon]